MRLHPLAGLRLRQIRMTGMCHCSSATCSGGIGKTFLRGKPLTRRSLTHAIPFAIAVLAWAPFCVQPEDRRQASMAPRA